MKGKLIPNGLMGATYTDVNDQDWSITLDLTQGAAFRGHLADTPNMYGKSTTETVVLAATQDKAAESIDLWVTDWNAGGNPGPSLLVDAKPDKGGGIGLLLLLVAAVLLADGKGRRR